MTARQLPKPSAVEIGVSGRAVRGIQWDWEQSDISLLMLHEPGADLGIALAIAAGLSPRLDAMRRWLEGAAPRPIDAVFVGRA